MSKKDKFELAGKGGDKKSYDGLEKFTRLHPTDLGREKLDKIKKKKTAKLEAAQPAKIDVEIKVDLFTRGDLDTLNQALDVVISKIRDGKYRKAMSSVDRELVTRFLEHYQDGRQKIDDEAAEKLIRIGKSFREYDPKGRDFLMDHEYDALLSVYLKAGNPEPTDFITPNIKGVEKTGITYPTLHNNMDKSYIVYAGEPIPVGVKETDSVEKFLHRIYKTIGISSEDSLTVELSPKIDGVSVNGTVVKDMLVKPQTRGDAEESLLVKGMDGLQVTTMTDLNDESFGIQYEAFVTEEDRKKLSEIMGREYVSCRHAASGVINRLTSGNEDELLECISLYPIMAEGLDGTYCEVIDYLQNFGIVPKDMPERKVITGIMTHLLKRINQYYHKLEEIRPKLSFAIDGMVITVTDDDYRQIIGRDNRTNRFQIALKFNPSSAEAKAKRIWLETGNKGFRTIQVDLEQPVFLDGVRYDHVPVLSKGIFDELDLREGSILSIQRVGDVIPSIHVKKSGSGEKLTVPNKCPDCGQFLSNKAGRLYCGNISCKSNMIGRILGFFKKLGLDSYGESFAKMAVEKYDVTGIGDLFSHLNEDELRKAKAGKKLIEFPGKLRKAVRETVDTKVIAAMGIPGISTERARKLLREFTPEELLKFHKNADKLKDHPSMTVYIKKLVGPQTVEFAVAYLLSKDFHDDLEEVLPYIEKRSKSFTGRPIKVGHSGITVTKELEDKVESLENVTFTDGKAFDVLLVESKDLNTEKVQRAKKKGCPIFTVSEFMELDRLELPEN